MTDTTTLTVLANLDDILAALPNSRDELETLVAEARAVLDEINRRLLDDILAALPASREELESLVSQARDALVEINQRLNQERLIAQSEIDARLESAGRVIRRLADESQAMHGQVRSAVSDLAAAESQILERVAGIEARVAEDKTSALEASLREQVQQQVDAVVSEVERVRDSWQQALKDLRESVDGRFKGLRIPGQGAPRPTKVYADGVLVGERPGIDFTGATVTDNGRDRVTVEITGGPGGGANLAYTASPTDGTVTSDSGTDATLTLAGDTNAGLMAPAEHTKLAGVEANATADQTAAEILAALLTVDGSGSGLDADTLDGHDTAFFETPAGAQAKADAKVDDTAYDATTWNGVTGTAPSKNAVRDQVELLAPLASPTFTGTPAAPTATQGTNTTQVATTAYVQTEVGLVIPKSLVDAKGDLLLGTADNTVARHAAGSNGQTVIFDSAQSDGVKNVDATRVIRVIVDGGGSALTTGAKKVYVTVPIDCTITKARLLADQSGSVVLDVWKDTYANFPPTVADTITASAKPTLSSAQKSEDSTLTGWTTTLAAGDIIEVNVDSATTVTKAILDLFVRPR